SCLRAPHLPQPAIQQLRGTDRRSHRSSSSTAAPSSAGPLPPAALLADLDQLVEFFWQRANPSHPGHKLWWRCLVSPDSAAARSGLPLPFLLALRASPTVSFRGGSDGGGLGGRRSASVAAFSPTHWSLSNEPTGAANPGQLFQALCRSAAKNSTPASNVFQFSGFSKCNLQFYNFLEALWEHVSALADFLAKIYSSRLDQKYLLSSNAAAHPFEILAESPSSALGKLIFELHVSPTKLEDLAARLGLNLSHIIIKNSMPKISIEPRARPEPDSTLFSLTEQKATEILCRVVNDCESWTGQPRDPHQAVVSLAKELNRLFKLLASSGGSASSKPHWLNRHQLAEVAASKAFLEWRSSLGELKFVDLTFLKSANDKFAFFLNLRNLIAVHFAVEISHLWTDPVLAACPLLACKSHSRGFHPELCEFVLAEQPDPLAVFGLVQFQRVSPPFKLRSCFCCIQRQRHFSGSASLAGLLCPDAAAAEKRSGRRVNDGNSANADNRLWDPASVLASLKRLCSGPQLAQTWAHLGGSSDSSISSSAGQQQQIRCRLAEPETSEFGVCIDYPSANAVGKLVTPADSGYHSKRPYSITMATLDYLRDSSPLLATLLGQHVLRYFGPLAQSPLAGPVESLLNCAAGRQLKLGLVTCSEPHLAMVARTVERMSETDDCQQALLVLRSCQRQTRDSLPTGRFTDYLASRYLSSEASLRDSASSMACLNSVAPVETGRCPAASWPWPTLSRLLAKLADGDVEQRRQKPPWRSWPELEADDTGKVLDFLLLRARRFRLALRWAACYRPDASTRESRTRRSSEFYAELCSIVDREGHQFALQLCRSIIDNPTMDQPKPLAVLLCSYFTLERLSDQLFSDEVDEILASLLGARILLLLGCPSGYGHLLGRPELIIEQLMMNSEPGKAKRAAEVWMSEQELLGRSSAGAKAALDSLALVYAKKALEVAALSPRSAGGSGNPLLERQRSASECSMQVTQTMGNLAGANSSQLDFSATIATATAATVSVGHRVEFSAADSSAVPRAAWTPDSAASRCMCCDRERFSMFQRRHHCRWCGRGGLRRLLGVHARLGGGVTRICDACDPIHKFQDY
uniref:FYVE domain-containing protein n=1 Tax=Macrostomum lignano TaxID=282301 RepID=A0A1I8JRA7_9PLAT